MCRGGTLRKRSEGKDCTNTRGMATNTPLKGEGEKIPSWEGEKKRACTFSEKGKAQRKGFLAKKGETLPTDGLLRDEGRDCPQG